MMNRRPIIDPLLMALESRTIVFSLASLLFSIAVLFAPALEAYETQIVAGIFVFALIATGKFTVEDVMVNYPARRPSPEGSPTERVFSDLRNLATEVVVRDNPVMALAKTTVDRQAELTYQPVTVYVPESLVEQYRATYALPEDASLKKVVKPSPEE